MLRGENVDRCNPPYTATLASVVVSPENKSIVTLHQGRLPCVVLRMEAYNGRVALVGASDRPLFLARIWVDAAEAIPVAEHQGASRPRFLPLA